MADHHTENNSGGRKLNWYERGVGPGAYMLPPLVGKQNHSLTHKSSPQYTIRRQLPTILPGQYSGPGPSNYLVPPGAKAKGKYIGPSFLMRPRPTNKQVESGPGPADYGMTHLDVYKVKAPAYSMGTFYPVLMEDDSPSPNSYMLGSTIGPVIIDKLAAAEVTMKGKPATDEKEVIKSPGPIYHLGKIELVKEKAPVYTMRRKFPSPAGNRFNAEPASYYVTSRTCTCKPGYIFGTKHNDFTGIFMATQDKAGFEDLD